MFIVLSWSWISSKVVPFNIFVLFLHAYVKRKGIIFYSFYYFVTVLDFITDFSKES